MRSMDCIFFRWKGQAPVEQNRENIQLFALAPSRSVLFRLPSQYKSVTCQIYNLNNLGLKPPGGGGLIVKGLCSFCAPARVHKEINSSGREKDNPSLRITSLLLKSVFCAPLFPENNTKSESRLLLWSRRLNLTGSRCLWVPWKQIQ